ncbi:MAG: ABC transporter ATP-binding protein, partial [Eubacteriaceae bacterium]|nr:ABC transporter ATP-binding protein [Eubacteriaceae bacterium]
MDMLTVKDVKKSFGSKSVVDGLSFSIPENSIFGFIGENGAGKTTTMKMILGLMKMDQGEIFVNGEKVIYGNTPTNKVIGYLPDVPEFYSYMTPREYLHLCGDISGLDPRETKNRVEELLGRVGLAHEKKRIKGFSRGMKQRLGIAQALMGKPKLLICDEPTSALDPLGRKELLDILAEARDETTIMFSTHILSDVEKICDRIAILHQGKVAFTGTMGDIKRFKSGEEYEVTVRKKSDLLILQNGFDGAVKKDEFTLQIHGNSDNPQ